MRATKMTSSHCRSVTPPLSRAGSSDIVPCLSPDLSRRGISPDVTFPRHRALSPDILDRIGSPDLPRRSRSPARPRSLMETLLVAKMEALSTGRLVRTDSLDSCSSFGSMSSLPSDVCRCDDCLLGIVDFYLPAPDSNKTFRKVCFFLVFIIILSLLAKIYYDIGILYFKHQILKEISCNVLKITY